MTIAGLEILILLGVMVALFAIADQLSKIRFVLDKIAKIEGKQ